QPRKRMTRNPGNRFRSNQTIFWRAVVTNSMQPRYWSSRLRKRAAVPALALAFLLFSGAVPTQSAQAQTFTVLYSFPWSNGANPYAGLVRDAAGNLYGTTFQGGASSNGTVFKVDSAGNETVLHS